MKVLFIAMTVLLAMLGLCTLMRVAPSQSVMAQQSKSQMQKESPFVCDRMALTPEIRKRHFEELGPALRGLIKSSRELADGYEFEFPSDQNTYAMLTEWIIQERLCCPFFDINLRLDREGGPLWMRLTGREGTKDFIKVDGAAWIKR